MRLRPIATFLAGTLLAAGWATAKESPDQQREKIRKMASQALEHFISSGGEGSGEADAAAKTGTSGGAYSGATMMGPGVWLYQITRKGLALQATLQGTKYSRDDELNKK